MTTTTKSTETTRWLDLPDAPDIPGLLVRFHRDQADYTRMATLMGAANLFDGVPYLPTAQSLEVEFEGQDGIDPRNDIIFAEVDGVPIGVASVERALRDGVPTYSLYGHIDPAFRRRRLGTALLAWNLARVRSRAATEDPDGIVHVTTHAEEAEVGARALAAKAGFEVVRHFFLMLRTGLDEIPDAPLPDGIEIRPVRPDHHRAIFDAENEAFRDHWGHREFDEGDYRATFGNAEIDTDLWIVAWDGDQVAGIVQNWVFANENERLGLRRGWLERISVRRPWRRRGLARAITAASLARIREAGLDEAMLGVDAANPNGALGLYEGLGFEVATRAEAFRRLLDR